MAHHRDVVVIGASSGGVEALSTVAAGLPADFPAAVFVVLHVSEDVPSHLPAILNRAGQLPAAHAVDREPIRRGRIYVAPPGLQTSVQQGRIAVRRGPRENMQRPSVDVLFRTAAHYYAERVVGVVLTGALDDGSAGLIAVKDAGGVAVVQDPAEAQMPSMPARALERADVDYCVAVHDIAPLLCALVAETTDGLPPEAALGPTPVPLETAEEARDAGDARRSEELGPPSAFTCPECSGTLFEIRKGKDVRFRCRVGHGYSEDTFVTAQNDATERALWVALRALEEREAVMHRMAKYARERGMQTAAERFDEKSRRVHDDVERVHDLIVNGRALEPVAEAET
jgi:two-component system chemotaxis response regulator CheB